MRLDCLDENGALRLVDGTLPRESRPAVERHIESCDACRELIATLVRADDAEDTDSLPDTERMPCGDGLSRVGPYRIEREIGRGAAGTVYRAVDERTNAVVALKYVTDRRAHARFVRETSTLARLDHPGIVCYIDHGEAPDGMYLAMEWLDGEDLKHLLCRGPLPWQMARLLGLRLTSALAHAHALGAVHRDLSSRNVFLPGGRVEEAKLLDFGLVRVADELERTTSRAILGTPHYMAPEQVKAPNNVDARADLFSLGVLLHEAVSGVRPFDGPDLFTIWVQIVDRSPPDLRSCTRDVPEDFVRLVEALLAKDPDARPASAAEVHQRLVSLGGQSLPPPRVAEPHPAPAAATLPPLGGHSLPVGPSPLTAPPPAPPSSRVGLIAGLVVGGLVLASTAASGAVYFVKRSGAPPPPPAAAASEASMPLPPGRRNPPPIPTDSAPAADPSPPAPDPPASTLPDTRKPPPAATGAKATPRSTAKPANVQKPDDLSNIGRR